MAVKNVFSTTSVRGSPWQRTQGTLDQYATKIHKNLSDLDLKQARYLRHARDSMIVTTRAWLRQGRFIQMFCNPSDMRWSLPRRGTVVKTTGGAVRNVWRNRYRGTYYDEGTVGITFQSGNIMPSAGYQDEAELRTSDDVAVAVLNPRVPPGLWNLYRFMELLDQPMMLGSWENRHIIIHHSRVFPYLFMEGYFLEENFSFSEIATDGNRVQWEATFQIYRTSPRLSSSRGLEAVYSRFIDSNRDEAFGYENMQKYLFPGGQSDMPRTMPVGTTRKAVTTVVSSSKDQQINDGVGASRVGASSRLA